MVKQALIGLGLPMTLVDLALSACGGGAGGSLEKEANEEVHHIPEDSQWYEGNLSLLRVT
jgi:hypothetical protein